MYEHARRMWMLIEPIHAVSYFTPEARAAYEEAGLRGYWRGYFAGRAAPLGRTEAAPVVAAFFGFAPGMVQRALPAVWDLASPEEALRARTAGAKAAIERLYPDRDVKAAADLLEQATFGLDVAGRVLAAANAALPPLDDPVARLWQAATLLREHRGDGHVAAMVSAELDGCEVQVLRSALDSSREILQPNRGWSDEDWESAGERLAERGLLGANGQATTAGAEEIRSVEYTTNRSASRPWAALGTEHTEHLIELLSPITRACAAELPKEFPIGLPPAEVIASTLSLIHI